MEKNIKKRVCRLALVLSAVLVVLFGYWFFLNPHGYWQKQKEAEKNEYMEKQMLWRKSEKMTMQQMLSDMTLMAKKYDCPFVDNEMPYGRVPQGHPVIVDYFYHEEIRGTENTGKRNR